jgi:hypothetical protein
MDTEKDGCGSETRIARIFTKQMVKRDADRLTEDFCFQLTLEEAEAVRCSRSQIVTLKRGQDIK